MRNTEELNLHYYLMEYPDLIEEDLTFIAHEENIFLTKGFGRIDLHFKDGENRDLFIEVKITADESAISQILKYGKARPFARLMIAAKNVTKGFKIALDKADRKIEFLPLVGNITDIQEERFLRHIEESKKILWKVTEEILESSPVINFPRIVDFLLSFKRALDWERDYQVMKEMPFKIKLKYRQGVEVREDVEDLLYPFLDRVNEFCGLNPLMVLTFIKEFKIRLKRVTEYLTEKENQLKRELIRSARKSLNTP